MLGQEPRQTGAERDGVITLLAALLSGPGMNGLSSSYPKRHIIGRRRVGYPGH